MMDYRSAYGRSHGVGYVESNLYAGASEHFSSLGIAHYKILKRSAETEKQCRRKESERQRRQLIRRAEIYR